MIKNTRTNRSLQHSSNRSGYGLIQMIVVIVTLGVMVAALGILLIRLIRYESTQTLSLFELRSAMRLERMFRNDARQSSQVEIAANRKSITLTNADGNIVWLVEPRKTVRRVKLPIGNQKPISQIPGELFSIEGLDVTFFQSTGNGHTLVSCVGEASAAPHRDINPRLTRRRLTIDVVAQIGVEANSAD